MAYVRLPSVSEQAGRDEGCRSNHGSKGSTDQAFLEAVEMQDSYRRLLDARTGYFCVSLFLGVRTLRRTHTPREGGLCGDRKEDQQAVVGKNDGPSKGSWCLLVAP